MKKKIKNLIDRLPYIKTIKSDRDFYKSQLNKLFVPPGHYYSPITSSSTLKKHENKIWKKNEPKLEGINLNVENQLCLLNEISHFYNEIPFKNEKNNIYRYYYENNMFSYSDAIFLYSIIRKFKPSRIVEIGSGFSSAVMLDTNSMFFENKIECTFIEPFPDRLNSLLQKTDNVNLLVQNVQNTDMRVFEELEKDDILFVDSTHVSKTGSDVNFIFFEVLPKLKNGVIIHFHDIFYPFEYPKQWVLEYNRSWNEDYILRAFLSYNEKFKIIAFNTYLEEFYKDWFIQNMPLCLKNTGGSLWLQVTK